MDIKKGDYTYDEVENTEGINQPRILIRYSTDEDEIEDTFDSLEEVKKATKNLLNKNIYIQSQILRDIL